MLNGFGVVRGIVVLSRFSRPRCLVPRAAVGLSVCQPPRRPPSLPPSLSRSRLFVSCLPHSDNSRIRHFHVPSEAPDVDGGQHQQLSGFLAIRVVRYLGEFSVSAVE